MKIEAEKNIYHGAVGWDSDPDLFAELAVTWQQWIGEAGEHLYAAQVLLPRVQQRNLEVRQLMQARQSARIAPSLTAIYFLHCALSAENVFKCVISSKCTESIRNEIRKTFKIPKVLLGHDLVELAGKARFETGTNEEYMLAFLSRYSVWAGKYPLPVRNADNAVTDKLSDGNHYVMGGYNPDTVHAFLTFCGEIYSWARAIVDASNQHTGGPA